MTVLLLSFVLSGNVEPEFHTLGDAVGWALADLISMPEKDRPFQRYVYIPTWANDEWPGAINFAVNTAASSSRTIQTGRLLANGWLMAFDLRRLAPNPDNLMRLQETWDSLALDDPYAHVHRQNSKVNSAVLAPHLKQQHAALLADMTFSTGAIYRADWFLAKLLTTLEGGRYYDFSGANAAAERAAQKKTTAQAEWLASLGVFEGTVRELAADQRAAIFRSNVTGKPRRIDFFFGLQRGNPVSITHDLADDDIDATTHPIRNLVDFRDSAREVIVAKPNGTHAFALFDGSGGLQSSVPDSIARDHTIPAPHTARLQPAISCIRCHGPHDGWIPFGNDVQKILASRLDVFSDVSIAGLTREEIVDRLAGQYAGQLDVPDGPVGRARRDYSAAAFRILSASKPQSKPDVKPVAVVSDLIGAIYSRYRYDMVTAEVAAIELGYPTLAAALGEPVVGASVDPIEGTLRAGVPINRSDFESIYADLAARSKPGGINQ